jgi:hypothetical protein
MKSSDTLGKISPALVAAINAIDGVKKGAANPAFKGTKYATLEAVIEAAHEHLSANGLAVLQGPGPMQGTALTVTTRIIHQSGEWIETDFTIPLAKQDPQAAGSAVTYARRYSLMAMLNMPAVDDDGEAAMQRGPAPKAVSDEPPSAVVQTATASLAMCRDEADLKEWTASNGAMIDGLSEVEKQGVRKAYAARQTAIKSATNPFEQKAA